MFLLDVKDNVNVTFKAAFKRFVFYCLIMFLRRFTVEEVYMLEQVTTFEETKVF